MVPVPPERKKIYLGWIENNAVFSILAFVSVENFAVNYSCLIPFMIYYFKIFQIAMKRTSKRRSGCPESGKGCKTRLSACAEWISELQGETQWE
jgi:hypothetical protein